MKSAIEPRDEFLSEEDLDLRNLTEEELHVYWDLWLVQAQTTNEADEHSYSHGVFMVEPRARGPDRRQGGGQAVQGRV